MSTVTIKTLTPVHVGSGRKLTKNIDFVFFSNLHNKPLAILDEEKIYQIVTDKHFEAWVSNIENPKQDLLPFLQRIKHDLTPQEIAHRLTFVSGSLGDKTKIHEHIYNGMMKPYIPGSSLKGAIRTALFAQLAINEKDKIKSKINPSQFQDKDAMSYLFSSNVQGEVDNSDIQNKDFLRFLYAGDAEFKDTQVIKVCTYNLRGQDWEERSDLDQWTECIPQGKSSELRIQLPLFHNKHKTMQNKLTQYIGKHHNCITSKENLIKTINTHTKTVLEKENKFIQFEDDLYEYKEHIKDLLRETNNCKPNECILRLGKHTGFTFMTGDWQKEVFDTGLYSELKLKARPKGDRYKEYPLPKTRRFTPDGQPLGFVKLTFND
jgi:CRISPR type III-A-associated RAMP protein Csm5